MEPNYSELNLNQENMKQREFKTICERCKKNKSIIFCEECKPFHYYCNQCDTSVHDLPSRFNHHRYIIDDLHNITELATQEMKTKNLISPKKYSQNSMSLNYNNINNKTDNTDINNNIQNNFLNSYFKNEFPPSTGNPCLLNHSYTYIYNSNGTAIGIGADECPKVYSKDYVNELKIMHKKEKEDLIYRITTLENKINRIKSSFNEQIEKIKFTQVSTEKECNDKIQLIKTEYDSRIESYEKEKKFKDNEIKSLNEQILEQKKINEDISSRYEELKIDFNNLQNEQKVLSKEYNILENKSKNEYDNLNQRIMEQMKSYDNYRKQANLDINNLISENERKIDDLLHQKELEIKEINFNHKENLKNELDNLTAFLTEKYENIIKEISNENNIYRKDNALLAEKIKMIDEKNTKDNDTNTKTINLLKKEIEEKNNKINEFQKNSDQINYKNNELEKTVSDLKNKNEELQKKIEEKSNEINDLNEKNLILNNEIKNVKDTNNVILDKINKLKEENRKIKVDFDTVDLECNNKLKNFKFIEERNAMLESENEKLKNKIEKYIKPLSFTYTYAQK